MKKPKCPYLSTLSKYNQCTHKGDKLRRKAKRLCGHKQPHNCEMFIDWLKKARKSKTRRRNTFENNIGGLNDKS